MQDSNTSDTHPYVDSLENLLEKASKEIQEQVIPTVSTCEVEIAQEKVNIIGAEVASDLIRNEVPTQSVSADPLLWPTSFIDSVIIQERIEQVALLIIDNQYENLKRLDSLLDKSLSDFVAQVDAKLVQGEEVSDLHILQRSMLMSVESFLWAQYDGHSQKNIDGIIDRYKEFKAAQKQFKSSAQFDSVWADACNGVSKILKKSSSLVRKQTTPVVEKQSTIGINRPSNPKTGPRNLQARVEAIARKQAAAECAVAETVLQNTDVQINVVDAVAISPITIVS